MSKEETGLTLTTGLHTPPAITVDQLQHYGRIFFESGMFPDIRSAAQAEVKVMAGIELGLAPLYSMTKIYIVKGRVMVGAEALGAMVKRSGRYDYKVVKLTDTECDMQFTDKGEAVYLSHFTIEDAKRADLMQPGGGWFKWPRAMLVSKAVSQGARIVCPEVIAGVYTPEDFGGATNPATGEVEGLAVIPPAETIPVAVSQAPGPQGTALKPEVVETVTPPAIDMVALRADMKKARWPERTALSWMSGQYKLTSVPYDTLALMLSRLKPEQAAEFVAKMKDLAEAAGIP